MISHRPMIKGTQMKSDRVVFIVRQFDGKRKMLDGVTHTKKQAEALLPIVQGEYGYGTFASKVTIEPADEWVLC